MTANEKAYLIYGFCLANAMSAKQDGCFTDINVIEVAKLFLDDAVKAIKLKI